MIPGTPKEVAMPSYEVRASCSVSTQQDRYATIVVEAATEEEARMVALELIQGMNADGQALPRERHPPADRSQRAK